MRCVCFRLLFILYCTCFLLGASTPSRHFRKAASGIVACLVKLDRPPLSFDDEGACGSLVGFDVWSTRYSGRLTAKLLRYVGDGYHPHTGEYWGAVTYRRDGEHCYVLINLTLSPELYSAWLPHPPVCEE